MAEYLKPSEVRVDVPFPFVGAFGKVEVEIAVAIVVLASRGRDAWEPVTMADAVAADESGAIRAWFLNPFLRLDLGLELALQRGLLEHVAVPGKGDMFQPLPACLEHIAKRPEVPRG